MLCLDSKREKDRTFSVFVGKRKNPSEKEKHPQINVWNGATDIS